MIDIPTLDRWRSRGDPDDLSEVPGCHPKAIREKLGLSPGQKVQAILYGDRIELIPIEPAKRLRGFLKGIDTTVAREPDRA